MKRAEWTDHDDDCGLCLEFGEARAFARGVLVGCGISLVLWAGIAAGVYAIFG